MLRIPRTVAAMTGLYAMASVLACGDGPTSIENGTENDSTANRPVADAPALPVPSSPTANVPVTSDTLARIEPLATNYRPVVDSVFGDWMLRYRRCAEPLPGAQVICGAWSDETSQQRWSSDLPPSLDGINAVFMHFPVPMGRVLLIEDGQHMAPRDTRWSDSIPLDPLNWYERVRTLTDAGLSDTVYVRRDRFWERKILEGGVGEYLLLIGDTEGSFSTTWTEGTETSETQTFGETVSVSGGLSLGVLSANVSEAVSRSFSTSVTITEAVTRIFKETVRGTSGKTVRFMVWELVERYTLTDENGDPFTDPNFAVRDEALYRRGVARALQATEF